VGTNKDILFDHNFGISILRPARAPVEVRENRGPEANRAVVADGYGFRVQLVKIDIPADPDIPANPRPAPFL
jgi:hypothetical protein